MQSLVKYVSVNTRQEEVLAAVAYGTRTYATSTSQA